MKKLALVILLAVAASWLLSEDRPRREDEITRYKTVVPPRPVGDRLVRLVDASHPARPESPRTRPRRKGDVARRQPDAAAPAVRPEPVWFPKSEVEEEARAQPDASGSRVLLGRLSASEDRARLDLRRTLEREVADWLAADVPPSWKPPAASIDAMVQDTYVQTVLRSFQPTPGEVAPEAPAAPAADIPGLDDLYTLQRAGQKVDFSPPRRARIVELYRRDLATARMQRLGGGLVAALACLLALTGYIRADEATRGYYTNRLRLAAAAGLGVAGVVAYRFLA